MRRTLTALPLLATAALFTACGEEEAADPSPPTVVSGEVQCRRVGTESTYELFRVDVLVEDLDGADDLVDQSPLLLVESARLEPTAAAETDDAGDEVRVRYTWEKGTADEPIFCGDDGKLLVLQFEVKDSAGFPVRIRIPSKPL